MTMAQTRNKFSRKTVAIAVAAGMSLGGVTVVAPTAGAVAGYEGAHHWYDATGDGVISPLSQEHLPTWGYPYSNFGGVFTDVPTSDGLLTGFSGSHVGYTAGTVKDEVKRQNTEPYGEATQLSAMKTFGLHPEAPTRDMSIDAKKMLYVAYSFANDIAKNEGLTQETRDALVAHGYKGDFYDELVMADDKFFSEPYDQVLLSDKRMSPEEIREKASTDPVMVLTKADYVATVASILAGAVYQLDGGANPVGINDGDANRLLTFGDMYDRNNFSFGDFDKLNEDDDRYSLAYAMIEIARNVSDEEINKSDLKVYKNPDPVYPLFFSLSNSTPAPVEDLPQGPEAPTEDLHVTNVKKDGKGDYVVTRSDGKTWTIELKDIRDALDKLEKKETVSPEDLKKVQDNLDKVEEDIKDLDAKDDALQKEIDQLKDDVKGLDTRVKNLEDRVTKLEGSVIKEVVKNSDGTYTLIREDGSKVPGNIDTTDGSVTNVKTDGKGNLIVTIDGKDKVVPLDQVKVVEENAGTPDHTVTITTPDGKSVTFNVFDTYVTNVEKQADGNYKVTRNDGESWIINLKDIRDKIAALEAKESPSKEDFDNLKKEVNDLKKQVDDLKAADKKLEGDITNLKTEIDNLDMRITKIEARLTVVEGDTAALTKCVAGAGAAGIPALLSIPLMVMTQLNIPGIKDLNTQVQKQIGMYNPELARQWERNGGVLQAGAVLAGLAGIIGGISYIAKQCDPMMKTPAGQDTDLGKLSSKLDEKGLGSSQKEKNTEAPQPDKQDAEAAEEADAENPAEAATEPSEELVDAQ